jgi:hypothetical protein
VPLVALGFAVAVQRVAAYDLGFDSASDEIDLIEVYGDYHRAHLSRFASLYTTGRGNYTISYPNNPTALALPLDNGRSIRGEDVTTSTWQSFPVPALLGLSVQPRSLSLFRAEEMRTLAGSIRLEGDGPKRRLVNGSELELRDATLVDFTGPTQRTERYLGTIAAGASLEIDTTRAQTPPQHVDYGPGPDPRDFLLALRTTREPRDENLGEIRLVAWAPGTLSGQAIDPPIDRLRGVTAVLVHLRCGPPPTPEGPRYNILALGPEKFPAMTPESPLEPGTVNVWSMPGRPVPIRRAPARRKSAMPVPPPPGTSQ